MAITTRPKDYLYPWRTDPFGNPIEAAMQDPANYPQPPRQGTRTPSPAGGSMADLLNRQSNMPNTNDGFNQANQLDLNKVKPKYGERSFINGQWYVWLWDENGNLAPVPASEFTEPGQKFVNNFTKDLPEQDAEGKKLLSGKGPFFTFDPVTGKATKIEGMPEEPMEPPIPDDPGPVNEIIGGKTYLIPHKYNQSDNIWVKDYAQKVDISEAPPRPPNRKMTNPYIFGGYETVDVYPYYDKATNTWEYDEEGADKRAKEIAKQADTRATEQWGRTQSTFKDIQEQKNLERDFRLQEEANRIAKEKSDYGALVENILGGRVPWFNPFAKPDVSGRPAWPITPGGVGGVFDPNSPADRGRYLNMINAANIAGLNPFKGDYETQTPGLPEASAMTPSGAVFAGVKYDEYGRPMQGLKQAVSQGFKPQIPQLSEDEKYHLLRKAGFNPDVQIGGQFAGMKVPTPGEFRGLDVGTYGVPQTSLQRSNEAAIGAYQAALVPTPEQRRAQQEAEYRQSPYYSAEVAKNLRRRTDYQR